MLKYRIVDLVAIERHIEPTTGMPISGQREVCVRINGEYLAVTGWVMTDDGTGRVALTIEKK